MEMKDIFEFMLSAEGWLVLAVVLFALEFFAPGVFFMWLGFGAIILGGIVFIFPDLAASLQLIIFAVLGVGFVIAGRSYIKKRPIQTEDNTLNQRGLQYIGKICEVAVSFKNGKGKVKVEDTLWSATGPAEFEKGASVKIVSQEGTRFTVEAVK